MATWSAVDWEERDWHPSEDTFAPRRARSAHVGPYRAAVVPEIADVTDLGLPDETLSLAEEASVEITRFDTELGATVAPFAALLLRSESAASSRIEQLTASAKAIAL